MNNIEMQEHSFSDISIPNLKVHPDARADQIKQQMLSERDNVIRTIAHLEKISSILLEHVRNNECRQPSPFEIAPVFVMRGGLILRLACKRLFPYSPCGMLTPYRNSSLDKPSIVYGNVPKLNSDGLYLLFDLLLATGATMIASLESLKSHVQSVANGISQVMIVTPFAAEVGIKSVLKEFPGVVIHTIWHKEKVDAKNKMVGPGFDIGDYALGGPVQRVQWKDS
jgi:uracil phosphoribosyltransferase